MLLYHHLNAGQNHDIKITGALKMWHRSIFGNDSIKSKLDSGKIRRRLNLGTACYHSVQNLFYSHLLSKNVIIRIYKTIILPMIQYGCETWSLTLRDEHKLRVFENRVLKRIFRPKRNEVTGDWRKLYNEDDMGRVCGTKMGEEVCI
jgi:hypothetical protein